MNFLNILKKFFKSKELPKYLINPNNLISIPTKNLYKDNPLILTQIDNFKTEYLTKLSLKNPNLNENELQTEMKMLIDLTLNIFLDSELITNMPNLEKRLNYLIISKKLYLYLNNINDLKNTLIAKLIALQEISQENIFLSSSKKNTIKNLFETLTNIYLIIQNQTIALTLETQNYLENGIKDYHSNKNSLAEEESIISKKRELLLKYEQAIFKKTIISISEEKGLVLKDIATTQKLLEIYVYKHQTEVATLFQELTEISLKYITTLDLNNLSKKETSNYNEELLNQITNLELKFRIFYEYGHNLITEIDLKELYNLKFDILTMAPIGFIEPLNPDDFELEYYEKIIYHQIELIITGKNPNFQAIFLENTEKAIEIFKNILKQGKTKLDIPTILSNKYLLNFLLSLNSQEDLISFLKNFKVKKADYIYFNFCNSIFDWEDELPLETIYRLMLSQNVGYDALLYELLKNIIYPDDNLYYLPEGITRVKNDTITFRTSSLNLTAIKTRELTCDKIVVLPSSLKEFNYNTALFYPSHVKKFIFKEGLEVSSDEIYNIEIISRGENKITYKDKRTNYIVTSDLNCKKIILNSKTYNLAGLLTFIPKKNLHIDEYTLYKKGSNSLEDVKNAIEARRNPEKYGINYTYANASTKYGDIYLELRNNYLDSNSMHSFSLALYQGKFPTPLNEVVEPKGSIQDIISIIRYDEFDHSTYFTFNPNFSNVSALRRNVWLYDKSIEDGSFSANPMYCTETNGCWGIIFPSGKQKLSENKKYLPNCFKNYYQLPEFENIRSLSKAFIKCLSKAYFGNNSNDCISIFKYTFSDHYKILINQIKKDEVTGKFYNEVLTQINIPQSNSSFIKSDFTNIINTVKELNLSENFQNFIITTLENYQNFYLEPTQFAIATDNYGEVMLLNLKDSLKNGYIYVNDILESCNIKEFVEKLLELLSKTYNVSVKDLLKNKLPTKETESSYTHKLEKKN